MNYKNKLKKSILEKEKKIKEKEKKVHFSLYLDIQLIILWFKNIKINSEEEFNEKLKLSNIILDNIINLVLDEKDKISQNKNYEIIEKMCEENGFDKEDYIHIDSSSLTEYNKYNKYYKESYIYKCIYILTIINILIILYYCYIKSKLK